MRSRPSASCIFLHAMDELMKTLEGREEDNAEQEPAEVVGEYRSAQCIRRLFISHTHTQNGLLAVHIAAIETTNQESKNTRGHIIPSTNVFTVEASMVDLLQLRMVYRGHSKWFPVSYTTSEHLNRLICGSVRHFPIQVHIYIPKRFQFQPPRETSLLYQSCPGRMEMAKIIG